MSGHSFFSPSAAARWIACPGSMTFPENQAEGGSSTFADDGTASHEWAAQCLTSAKDAASLIGATQEINGKTYTMDESRADFVQVYLDDVRSRATGMMWIEYHVDLSDILGEGQGGTADAIMFNPEKKHLTVEDLKYGTGEKVYAKDNPQLGLYLLGAIRDIELLGYKVETVTSVICQPRLGHIDEHTTTVRELYALREQAKLAVETVRADNLHPGEKQCRWCRAKAVCPALAKYVADQVKCDFDVIQSEPSPVAPRNTAQLSLAYSAVPLIEDWCRAVRSELSRLVQEGTEVIGPDGKPFKFVEGKQGSRAWDDLVAAEAALVGQLGPKAYTEPRVITAPVAAKLLDKKATKSLWKDVFEPLIKRGVGQPILTIGSDPRPPFSGAADADDFQELGE